VAAIHVNMCVAMPRFTRPWQLLQIANAIVLPRTPLFATQTDIKAMRVGFPGLAGGVGH
jgi:hypothetical protein